jgi:hypothetical protein
MQNWTYNFQRLWSDAYTTSIPLSLTLIGWVMRFTYLGCMESVEEPYPIYLATADLKYLPSEIQRCRWGRINMQQTDSPCTICTENVQTSCISWDLDLISKGSLIFHGWRLRYITGFFSCAINHFVQWSRAAEHGSSTSLSSKNWYCNRMMMILYRKELKYAFLILIHFIAGLFSFVLICLVHKMYFECTVPVP